MYVVMDTLPGQSIDDACVAAIGIAKAVNMETRVTFNGTEILVRASDNPDDLVATYRHIREQDQRRRGIK